MPIVMHQQTTANWGTARTITIGSAGKSVNGSGNVSWSLSEIGAAPTSHAHNFINNYYTSRPTSANVGVIGDGRLLTFKSTGTMTTAKPGAAPTSHAHNFINNYYTSRPTSANVGVIGDGRLLTFKSTGTMTTAKPCSDGHILHFEWDNAGGYSSQIFIGNQSNPKMQIRGMSSGTWGDWHTVYSTNNKPTSVDVGALALSGGTMTGSIRFSGGGYSGPAIQMEAGDHNGAYIGIGAGGLTVIGSGESTATVRSNISNSGGGYSGPAIQMEAGDHNGAYIGIGAGGLTVIGSGESTATVRSNISNATDEKMIIASDSDITFHAGLQNGYGSRKTVTITSSGVVDSPQGFKGALNGNASTATKLADITFHAGLQNGYGSRKTVTITSSGVVDSPQGFKGALNGNASTATKLANARTINGTNFDGTANITTANWGTARNIQIGNTTRSVNGSGNVTWSHADIGTYRTYIGHAMGGSQTNITTDQFLTLLTDKGAFSQASIFRGSWHYAGNNIITDTGCGNIHLAGAVIEVVGRNRNECTIRIHTATTSSNGGMSNGDFIYVNNDSGFSPGWRRLYNTKNKPTAGDIGALPLTGGTMTGAIVFANYSAAGGNNALLRCEQLKSATGNGQLITTNNSTIYVGNPSTLMQIESNNNPNVVVGNNRYTMYHTGNKPTPADIGAAAASHTHNRLSYSNNLIQVDQPNDYAGLGKKNNVNIDTWYGFSISNKCSGQSVAVDGVAFSVNARNGEIFTPYKLTSSMGTGTHLNGAKGTAIINSTSTEEYVMLAKMESKNGKFTLGKWTTKFVLNYIENGFVSTNNNSFTKQVVLLDESGNSNFPGTVSAPTFSGSLSGNASTATTLQTARTINGTSFNGSGNITTANWGTARTITIGSAGKSVNGSGNVSWSLSEIGAVPLSTGGNITIHADSDASTTNEYLMLKAGHNELKITTSGGGSTVTKGQDKLTFNGNVVYHAGKKPTPADIGAAPSSHTHSSLKGASGGNPISSSVSTGYLQYNYGIERNTTGLFPWVSNANGLLTINKHEGNYYSQLGFSSNGKLYYRNFEDAALNTTTGWSEIAFTSSVVNAANKLATARSINGTNFDGTGNITTANWGTARNIQIGNTTRSVNGSGNYAWSLADIGAAASNHNHGLLHDNLTVSIASTTTDNGWSMINSSYYNGFILKSIRTDKQAPAWLLGNYAAGIAFGGSDTKGVMSVSYDGPWVRFAGGNGSKPVWNFTLKGSNAREYDLDRLYNATSDNAANMIVRRDGNGNFKAGTITASLSGNAGFVLQVVMEVNLFGILL